MLDLLLREEWRSLPPEGAFAAVNAGEPKRALSLLAGETGPVAAALRHAADILDINWFPGGAGAVGFAGVDITRLSVPPEAAAATPESSLPAYLLVHLTARTPAWRSIVSNSRRNGDGFSLQMITEAQEVLQRAFEVQDPQAIAASAYTLAELVVLAGLGAQAGGALGIAREMYQAVGDRTGEAACLLAEGDWAANPYLHPETLGEDLEPRSAGQTAPVLDPVTAARRYAAAEELYVAAGSRRGVAAVALRQARLALAADDPAGAVSALDRASLEARDTGDGALRMLILVQHALATVRAGGQVDADAVGAEVAGWAGGVGSSSYARGLSRVCHAMAQRWRGVDVLHGRRALLLGEAIGSRVGAPVEAAIFDRERGELYVGANYRRAAFVWTMLELQEAQAAAPASLDPLVWVRFADRVLRAQRDANALADAEALGDVRGQLEWLVSRQPADLLPPADQIPAMIGSALEESDVLTPLYRGTTARARGESSEADFAEALAAARGLGNVFLEIIVLGTMHRRDEAAALLEPLLAALPADAAAALLIRLHRYQQALEIIEQQPPVDATTLDRPWEPAARHAEALLGVGRPEPAAALAETAITHFENHLARLSRDILRVTAGDDLTVAGLYTVAVRAHTSLGALGRGFELSDRCRGASLMDLVSVADGPAVRDWHRAGATLARTIEGLARSATTAAPAEIRRRVAAAERDLDDAEVRMVVDTPGLRDRRKLPGTPALAEIQARLEPGTLLLQYHAFDDTVVAWAVTADAARAVTRDAPTPQLTAAVRRYHSALAEPGSPWTDLGRPLADLLLEPFAAELATCRRVIVVPYGGLAVLPFHVLLPADHDVSYLPAASLLPARRTPVGSRALVLGNPAYASGRGLDPLKGAEVEAVTIARLRGQEALRGGVADRKAVLDRIGAADVVHLATHGLLSEGAPYSAELALAGDDSLTVPDLAGLGVTIDLAVLSACDSGRGRATSAGDVVGLTRAFLAAGVRQTVVSLWPVHDKVACVTMVAFHRALLDGREPAAALAAAQREVRGLTAAEMHDRYRQMRTEAGRDPATADPDRTRHIGPGQDQPPASAIDHPFYWAPFIHVGG